MSFDLFLDNGIQTHSTHSTHTKNRAIEEEAKGTRKNVIYFIDVDVEQRKIYVVYTETFLLFGFSLGICLTDGALFDVKLFIVFG